MVRLEGGVRGAEPLLATCGGCEALEVKALNAEGGPGRARAAGVVRGRFAVRPLLGLRAPLGLASVAQGASEGAGRAAAAKRS